MLVLIGQAAMYDQKGSERIETWPLGEFGTCEREICDIQELSLQIDPGSTFGPRLR